MSAPTFDPTPFTPCDLETFPRRQWLFGRHYARRYVSTTIAPGDVGKTSLSLIEAISMATHRNLIGVSAAGPLKVWNWNGEDPREEAMRRVLAICKYYQIPQDELTGNLFLDSGRDMKLTVAVMESRGGFKILVPVKEALTEALIRRQIDVFIADPFVKTHRVSENDNALMDEVATLFAEIGDDANCAIELVQHSRKTYGAEVGLEDARGASSIVAATRMARTLNRMSKDAADLAGVTDDHRLFFRVDAVKSNMAPPDQAKWFRLKPIGLGNNSDGPEDIVQVVERWEWPDPFAGVTVHDLREVQRRTSERPRRLDPRAKDWIGALIIDVLRLDPDNKAHRAKAKKLFEQWRKNNMFRVVSREDEHRHLKDFVEVMEFAND
jgi:hypothetical protein